MPAARPARPAHVAHDPQLEARNFFVPLQHRVMGTCDYEAPATLFSATPMLLHRAAPCLGEHTDLVLRDLLGYGPEEIAALRTVGVVEQQEVVADLTQPDVAGS